MDIREIIDEVTRQVESEQNGATLKSDFGAPAPEVSAHLEHSLLTPDISLEKIRNECMQARRYCVAAVCVSPYYVGEAVQALRGSNVAVCAAIGFPHGAMSGEAKLEEAKDCLKNGAHELDVAMNILAIKSGKLDDARAELEQIVRLSEGRAKVKAVFEHSVYNSEEKAAVLNMVRTCGAEYVKIQNVLSGKGADVEDVQYARGVLGRNVKIKIDGGVKTLKQVKELLEAGADRIGLTATVSIAREALGIV
ncbi:MAG: deoxyribose-phosphate aldolase [Christensenella sp.]